MSKAIDESDEPTLGNMFILAGELTLWGCPGDCEDTNATVQLRLSPQRPIVIGRAEGGSVPYLDPAYRPTTLLPNTGQTIMRGRSSDHRVSRGHFMLRAGKGRIILVNGVPHRDGGIRPPMNGTKLLAPTKRRLDPGECYEIPCGTSVVLRLPNGAEIEIGCE
jgi:hypothetical protein